MPLSIYIKNDNFLLTDFSLQILNEQKLYNKNRNSTPRVLVIHFITLIRL